MFIAILPSTTKTRKQPILFGRTSIDRWMDKENVVRRDSGILFSHKRECSNAICSNTDGPRDDYSKRSQSHTKSQIPLRCHSWNFKKDTNELIYKTDSQTWRTEVWLLRGRKGRRGTEWESGISRCQLPYIEWINTKVLQHSINYIYILWWTILQKNTKKNVCIHPHTHVCTYRNSHSAVQQINTTL